MKKLGKNIKNTKNHQKVGNIKNTKSAPSAPKSIKTSTKFPPPSATKKYKWYLKNTGSWYPMPHRIFGSRFVRRVKESAGGECTVKSRWCAQGHGDPDLKDGDADNEEPKS